MNSFNPKDTIDYICTAWKTFQEMSNVPNKWVLGISGGKDSTFSAKLGTLCVGKDNVYGVLMPNGTQKDIDDSRRVIDMFGIQALEINIEDAYRSIIDGIENNAVDVKVDTKLNLPPRLRTSVLYAVAQSVNGVVICNSNLTERVLGYGTIFGDTAGSWAPLKNLTVTEIIECGKYLRIPDDLICKTPGDGLQDLGDEERLGVKYSEVDKYIRTGIADEHTMMRTDELYTKNLFKWSLLNVCGPDFDFDMKFMNADHRKQRGR